MTEPAKRIGHRMRELQAIVSAMPGCTKSDALRAAGLPTHGLGSGRELRRTIDAAWSSTSDRTSVACSPPSATADAGTSPTRL